MKIAMLGSRGIPASHGGFETFYEQLSVRLAGRGHRVTVYNRAHHIRTRNSFYRGVRLVYLPSIRTKHFDTFSHTFLSMVHALVSGHDIYYICVAGNSPLCIMPRLAGGKTVINVDGADAEREKWEPWAKAYIRWSERLACRVGDVILADSKVISKRYKETFGRETIYIPYGSTPWPRENERGSTDALERFGLESEQYILFVSRLTPENQAHLLVEAHRASRTRAKLVIIGDAPYMTDYKKYLQSLCDERVIMTGYQFGDAYRQLSCHCLFFVLPSGIDGTRPVLLDQMGFGNCVVVRNTPANMEVIGDSGLWFDKNRPAEALAEQIERLTGDHSTVKHFRQKALARARDAFSWERTTDQYEALFHRMLAEKRQKR